MNPSWQAKEATALGLLALLFLAFLLPALKDSAQLVRDEQRIADLARIKRRLEQYYNTHQFFPPTATAAPRSCALSGAENSPLWRASDPLLRHPPLPQERRREWPPYLYCPTQLAENKGEEEGAPAVAGFILQAALEHSAPAQAGFDDEPGRHYRFRVFRDGSRTVYRICGGTDLSCAAAAPLPP